MLEEGLIWFSMWMRIIGLLFLIPAATLLVVAIIWKGQRARLIIGGLTCLGGSAFLLFLALFASSLAGRLAE